MKRFTTTFAILATLFAVSAADAQFGNPFEAINGFEVPQRARPKTVNLTAMQIVDIDDDRTRDRIRLIAVVDGRVVGQNDVGVFTARDEGRVVNLGARFTYFNTFELRVIEVDQGEFGKIGLNETLGTIRLTADARGQLIRQVYQQNISGDPAHYRFAFRVR